MLWSSDGNETNLHFHYNMDFLLLQTLHLVKEVVPATGLIQEPTVNQNVLDVHNFVKKFWMTCGCHFLLGRRIHNSQVQEKRNTKNTFTNARMSDLNWMLSLKLTYVPSKSWRVCRKSYREWVQMTNTSLDLITHWEGLQMLFTKRQYTGKESVVFEYLPFLLTPL